MCQSYLSGFILQDITLCSLEHTDLSIIHKPRCVLTQATPASARFYADHFYVIVYERMKKTYRIRSASDAGDHRVGQTTFFF